MNQLFLSAYHHFSVAVLKKIRSSRLQMFLKIGVLNYFAISVLDSLFYKVAGLQLSCEYDKKF